MQAKIYMKVYTRISKMQNIIIIVTIAVVESREDLQQRQIIKCIVNDIMNPFTSRYHFSHCKYIKSFCPKHIQDLKKTDRTTLILHSCNISLFMKIISQLNATMRFVMYRNPSNVVKNNRYSRYGHHPEGIVKPVVSRKYQFLTANQIILLENKL